MIARLTIATLCSVLVTGFTATVARAESPGDAVQDDAAGSTPRPAVEVWKSPTCGCCEAWVSYLEKAGFPVTAHNSRDMNAVKAKLGLPGPSVASCHTAIIDGYVVEGHVPVSDIEKLLTEKPDLVGISAPGMPMNSPGMGSEEPSGYDVISFDREGRERVFSSH